nr:putative ribonuclease H-like domain-containing protein [Tanacetum cinerariifolium]
MLAQPTVVKGEGSGNPPESQPTPSPAQPINESQIPKSSSSPQNTQSPKQTLKGIGFPHIRGPNFLDPSVDVEAVHKEGVTVWEKVKVVVPGAKKPWEVQWLRLDLRVHLYSPLIHLSQQDVHIEMIVKDKGNGEKGGSTAKTVSTARLDISAARPEVSTGEPKTPPTTETLFDDEDVTIADTLMLDYGFNFMNTKIYFDNESTICIVKNPVYHSKIKHIEIRHHFIRDSYEKKLIQVLKIQTDDNVADLLTKAFDVIRFNFLKANIGMLNL